MAYFLGIDGGGTKTRSAVGDGTRVLGESASTGCNIVRVGREQARSIIHESIAQACRIAGVKPSQIACACIGTAGISVPTVADAIRQFVAETIPCEIVVRGDNEIAMEAAFFGGPGVIVASGTGSIACGRNAQGEYARAGGYGFAISDEGSGHWIGRAAVMAMMRAIDGEQRTSLSQYVLQAWRAESAADVVKIANAAPDFAALFPLVLQAAREGDSVASELLTHAGRELAVLGGLVIRRIWPDNSDVAVATVGGVFASAALVREEFRKTLQNEYPNARVQSQVSEPVLGALSFAKKEWEGRS